MRLSGFSNFIQTLVTFLSFTLPFLSLPFLLSFSSFALCHFLFTILPFFYCLAYTLILSPVPLSYSPLLSFPHLCSIASFLLPSSSSLTYITLHSPSLFTPNPHSHTHPPTLTPIHPSSILRPLLLDSAGAAYPRQAYH